MREQVHRIDILIQVEDAFLPKAEYVFRTFCRMLGLQPRFHTRFTPGVIRVFYGNRTNHPYPIEIYHDPEAVKFFDKRLRYPDEKINFFRFRDENIPFLFSKKGDIFHLSEKTIRIQKDIVSSAFYFLTCWQELAMEDRLSPENRYPWGQSHQSSWDFTDIPVVDRYCEILEKCVDHALPFLFKRDLWPQKRDFAVSLSHDIDFWNFWTRAYLDKINAYNLKRFWNSPFHASYKLLFHNVLTRLFHDPTSANRRIFEHERILDLTSSVFLMAKTDNEDSRHNYLSRQRTLRIVRSLLNPAQCSLHGSREASFNADVMALEVQRLGSLGFTGDGYRAHYLSFSYQTTFGILEDIGVRWDSTLGFWEHCGYRAGTSFPFHPFNIAENRPFRVLEIPLVVMDTSLYSPRAMNLSVAGGVVAMDRMLHRTQRHGGHLSLLWHNNSFDPVDFPGWGRIYWHVVHKAHRMNAWLCSYDDLYQYWISR